MACRHSPLTNEQVQAFRAVQLPYLTHRLNDLKVGRIDRLSTSKDRMGCRLLASKRRVIFQIIKPAAVSEYAAPYKVLSVDTYIRDKA